MPQVNEISWMSMSLLYVYVVLTAMSLLSWLMTTSLNKSIKINLYMYSIYFS